MQNAYAGADIARADTDPFAVWNLQNQHLAGGSHSKRFAAPTDEMGRSSIDVFKVDNRRLGFKPGLDVEIAMEPDEPNSSDLLRDQSQAVLIDVRALE
ncbi:MAG: hypothetical protein ABWZ80_01005 [Beijerinckiaceae bacterium]